MSAVINVTAVQNFVVICDKFNVDKICTSGFPEQWWWW